MTSYCNNNHELTYCEQCAACNGSFLVIPEKKVCACCIHDLALKFKEKENFCQEHGDPIQMIVEKLNEHAKAINALDGHLQKLLSLVVPPVTIQ